MTNCGTFRLTETIEKLSDFTEEAIKFPWILPADKFVYVFKRNGYIVID